MGLKSLWKVFLWRGGGGGGGGVGLWLIFLNIVY